MELFDLVIIGGGIHGCGVAVDAAGRGLKVALFEQNDLGSGTSSASTKLIHGGLRYLETFEFNLVRQCLIEQNLLLDHAGYLVEPLPFVIPVNNKIRPLWMIKLGLFFYDSLTRRSMPRSTTLSQQDVQELALIEKPSAALRYYDCQTDDHRLVIADALYAQKLGAKIKPRHKVIKIVSKPECWHIQAQGPHGIIEVKAKSIVNTTGPWINNLLKACQLQQSTIQLKLVQGSHIVLPKLYPAHEALAYQHNDGRLIFFVPYLDKFTLVGTTEVVLERLDQKPCMTESECQYLLQIVEHVFGKSFSKKGIVHHYAGVRALVDDNSVASKTSRDYKIETVLCPEYKHPRIDILGGKITTWRLVSEEIVNTLSPYFKFIKPAWTKKKILPGARYKTTSTTIFHELAQHYPLLPSDLMIRYAKTYGLRSFDLIGERKSLAQFGALLAPTLYEREVEFLINHEWAKTSEDILYRRTKLGLSMSAQERAFFSAWLGEPHYAFH